jgi:hypothetical protein
VTWNLIIVWLIHLPDLSNFLRYSFVVYWTVCLLHYSTPPTFRILHMLLRDIPLLQFNVEEVPILPSVPGTCTHYRLLLWPRCLLFYNICLAAWCDCLQKMVMLNAPSEQPKTSLTCSNRQYTQTCYSLLEEKGKFQGAGFLPLHIGPTLNMWSNALIFRPSPPAVSHIPGILWTWEI